tara:strand:+ start:75005 stop:77668 length:2664 start_codon:yes stop_codon:yes gene_type:complete
MFKKSQLFILSLIISTSINSQNTIEIDCEEVFLSGSNIAWADFASDVGRFNVYNPSVLYEPYYDTFNTYFSQIKAAGGNSVRWWLHTDASYTPQIEYSGNVTGLSAAYTNQEITDQVRKILDLAWSNGVYMTISLFSFDILSSPNDRNGTSINFIGNQNFLESPANVQSYIDNALTPMVLALKDHPALFSWEIFNEPEGMSSEFGWTGNQGGAFTTMSTIQMVVNKLAGAIHDADPDALVTNGAWSMLVNTDIDLNFSYAEEYQKNYYSDSELIAAGGATNGTLDFYQVHYYDWQHENISPLHHPASYWQLDKPIMLGEFHAAEVQSIAVDNGYPVDGAYEFLYDQGYFGAWGWQWKSPWLKADIEPQINHMQTAQPSVVAINIADCPANTLDDDNDGVTNDVDLCPNTPDGDLVNSDGCSTNDLGDSDNDGVINGTDACPNTPNGESVDANGCSTNELLDDDNDGVINGNDLCSSTPSNELVNSDGCSGSQLDDDQDGVTNNLDHCENTPLGETVNANGCTDNQIDDDQDGVINDLDLCPETPIGYSVDSDGCGLINIPDSNFEQALIDLGIDTDNTINQQLKYIDAKDVSTLDVSNKNISSLIGIEAFTSLTTLSCYENSITELDISQNIALKYFYCSNNFLTNLDVTNNVALVNLQCMFNQLVDLDVSNNILLTNLSCNNNQLVDLDVSNNPQLTVLSFQENEVSAIDLTTNSQLMLLYGYMNKLVDLDLSLNDKLIDVRVSYNLLESLNIQNGNNNAINIFLSHTNPNLTCIQVDNETWSTNNWNNIDSQSYFSEDCNYVLSVEDSEVTSEFSLYPNPSKDLLYVNGNVSELKEISVYNLMGQMVMIVKDNFNEINISRLSSSIYIVKLETEKGIGIFRIIKE